MSPSPTDFGSPAPPESVDVPTRAELDARFNVHSRLFTHQDPNDDALWARLHDMPEASFTHLMRQIHGDVVTAASELADDPELSAWRGLIPASEADRVVSLGDSITADRGSWFEMLACVAELSGLRSHWINGGTSGDSSTHARARFDRAVTPHEPTWVLIALGTNDAKRSTRVSGGRLVPVEETQANLVEIVDLVRSIGAKPVLLTPPPVDELLMRDWRFDEALTWRNEDIALSAQSVREAAAARAVPLVDVHRQLASPEGGWHLPDGLHPNREGQARIARSVITSAPWGA